MFSQVFVCSQWGGSALGRESALGGRGLPWEGVSIESGLYVGGRPPSSEARPSSEGRHSPPRIQSTWEDGQYAVCTHPTGMHYCYLKHCAI